MSLFQHTVLKKQMLAASEKIHEAYKLFTTYFHNPESSNNLITGKKHETDSKKAGETIIVNDEVKAVVETSYAIVSSKRKKDGVFYTPRYITTYIVGNTLGKLCTDKKLELKIDESEYITDKKRPKAQVKQLFDKLTMYREWLLSLTICDPACGLGAFLDAALDFLMAEHRFIDELTAKLFGNAIVFPNIENAILENNLYGVDISEESVEIAKLALWSRTDKPQRQLNSLNDNIKCGNSLIADPEVGGEKAFNWHKEFPQVFEKGGFDVVIGNPPYVIVFDKQIKAYLEKNYSIFKRNNDLYTAFISQSIENLLKDNGVISLITPNSYIRGDYFKPVRELLIKFRIGEIIDFGNILIFEEANVFSAIFTLVKNKMPSSFFLKKNIEDTGSLVVANSSNFIPRNEVIEKMQSYKTFDNFFEIKDVGYNYWSIGRGKIRGNSIGSRILYSGGKRHGNDIPYLKGSNISRYHLSAPQQYLLHNYNEYLNENDIFRFSEDFFNVSPKLIYRQTSSSLVGALDFEKIHNDKTVHIIAPKVDTKVDMRYVLALFNSTLLNYVYSCLTEEAGRAFAQVKTASVKKLPFILAENQQPFIDLADKMLSLNSELQIMRQRFLKRLSDSFTGIKITGALERFNELAFNQFLAELAKQKITLSLEQQDGWAEFFDEYKKGCTNLVNQINTTDKEIDRMVYELYGLTEELQSFLTFPTFVR